MSKYRPDLSSPLSLDMPALSPSVTDSCDLLLPTSTIASPKTPTPIPDDWPKKWYDCTVGTLTTSGPMIPMSERDVPMLPAPEMFNPGLFPYPILPIPILPPSNLVIMTMVMLNGLAESSNLPLPFPPAPNSEAPNSMVQESGSIETGGETTVEEVQEEHAPHLSPVTTTKTCNICKSVFHTEKRLHTHHCKTYSAGSICLLCDTLLPDNILPKDHLKTVHDIQKPMACGCCSWLFRDQRSVMCHGSWIRGKFTLAPEAVVINNCKPGAFATKMEKGAQEYLTAWQAKHQRRISKPLRSTSTPFNQNQPSVNNDSLDVSNLSLITVFNGGASVFELPSTPPASSPAASSPSSSESITPNEMALGRGNRTKFLIKNILC